jgi:hypothetical protein
LVKYEVNKKKAECEFTIYT